MKSYLNAIPSDLNAQRGGVQNRGGKYAEFARNLRGYIGRMRDLRARGVARLRYCHIRSVCVFWLVNNRQTLKIIY